MSKLYEEYLKQKKINNNTLYLFKSGIFYIALDEDAQKLSDLFSFKITNLNENVVKCGFPQNRLDYYINLLNNSKISFEIIDNYSKVSNHLDYIQNVKIKSIIDTIINIDMNDITFKESFEILEKINKELKEMQL